MTSALNSWNARWTLSHLGDSEDMGLLRMLSSLFHCHYGRTQVYAEPDAEKDQQSDERLLDAERHVRELEVDREARRRYLDALRRSMSDDR